MASHTIIGHSSGTLNSPADSSPGKYTSYEHDLDLNTTYLHLLKTQRGVAPVDSNYHAFVVQDFDPKNKRLKNVYLLVERKVIKVSEELKWLYGCSCHPARQNLLTSISSTLTGCMEELDLQYPKCIHIESVEKYASDFGAVDMEKEFKRYCNNRSQRGSSSIWTQERGSSGYSALPDKSVDNSGYSTLPDKAVDNLGYSALPDKAVDNSGYSALPDKAVDNSGYSALPDKAVDNSNDKDAPKVNRRKSIIKSLHNLRRRLVRLERRVKSVCTLPNAPLMAFIVVSHRGKVKVVGSPSLCQTIAGFKGHSLKSFVTPAVEKAQVTQKTPTVPEVDCRGIDLSLDVTHLDSKSSRNIYSNICVMNGDGPHHGFYKKIKKPEYWPEGIPFCSPSATKADGKGRALNTNDIRTVIQAFIDHCHEKLRAGYRPINYVPGTIAEEIFPGSSQPSVDETSQAIASINGDASSSLVEPAVDEAQVTQKTVTERMSFGREHCTISGNDGTLTSTTSTDHSAMTAEAVYKLQFFCSCFEVLLAKGESNITDNETENSDFVSEKKCRQVLVQVPEVDCRGIDLSLDVLHLDPASCKKIYSSICLKKGEGERRSYDITNKPEYWPVGIPFCSHSAKRADGKGRALNTNDIRTVIQAFIDHCHEKLYAGYRPINYIPGTIAEEIIPAPSQPSVCETRWAIASINGDASSSLVEPAVDEAHVTQSTVTGVSPTSSKGQKRKYMNHKGPVEKKSASDGGPEVASLPAVKPGEGERGAYNITKKPEYWPADIPFCSPSTKKASEDSAVPTTGWRASLKDSVSHVGPAVGTDAADGKGRALSTEDIRTVIQAFIDHCHQKLCAGYRPKNCVPGTIAKAVTYGDNVNIVI